MGFYTRKSINFGGTRFDFSKSGIGASVGVKGFRVGTNSRGNYIHMGRGGLHYRAVLGKKQTRRMPQTQSLSTKQTGQPYIQQEELHFQDVDSGDIARIVDSSSQEVVNEINAKRKKIPLWPFAIILAFVPSVGIPLALISILLLALLVDKKRKTTVLVYDVDEDTEQDIQRLYNAFGELVNCNSAWHISSQAAVRDRKYQAGANQIVKRTAIRVQYSTPKYLKTNVKVPSIPVGTQTIYFFPDRILIYDKKAVGGLAYSSFSVTQKNQRFIENGAVPRDGTIVDHTWQYVNKSGGPDKRFANNRQLPILLYSEVYFTSSSGLNELVEFSRQGSGADLVARLEQYKRSSFLSTKAIKPPSSGSSPTQNTLSVSPDGGNFHTVNDVIQNYIQTTRKESLFLMPNIESLVSLIKKVFPNENCTSENIAEYVRRLALVNTPPSNDGFVPVQPIIPSAGESSYSPEKIQPNSSVKANSLEPYATFKKMKQIGGQYGGYEYSGDADSFRNQALFMVDFTDKCEENTPLDTYYTTYSSMNDAQLRTYFTWRTKARQGVLEPTSLSYVFCYIFELINDVGVANPADAVEKLIALWTEYRKFDEKIDRYLRDWIRDYYVDHKPSLPTSFVEFSSRFPVPYHGDDLDILTRAKSCSWDDLHVIEASSSFKITNGQFYKAGNQEIIERCVCYIIREMSKVFKSSGVDFKKLFVENRREKVYSLYQGAVHAATIAPQPVVIELDAFESMKYNSRGWNKEYVSITQYKPAVGYILKLIEVKLRQRFGYKRDLQAPAISVVENCFLNSEPEKFNWPNRPTLDKLKGWKGKAYAVISGAGFEAGIDSAVEAFIKANYIFIENGKIRINRPVEIDMSKLKDIEREHIATAKKLIVEEAAVTDAILPVVEPVVTVDESVSAQEGIDGLLIALPPEGKNLLRIILQGKEVPPNSELLIETINEKALEAINDNLIDYAEGIPYVYDDYIEDLQQKFGGQ